MLSASFLPDWMPYWLQLIVLIGGILAALAYLVMPFSVFGLKARLDRIDDRLDEIQADIRNLIARLPEPGLDERYVAPAVTRSAPLPAAMPPIPSPPPAAAMPPPPPPMAEPPGRSTWLPPLPDRPAPDHAASDRHTLERHTSERPVMERPGMDRPSPARPDALRPDALRPSLRPEPARPPEPRPAVPLRAEPREGGAWPRDPSGRSEPRLR